MRNAARVTPCLHRGWELGTLKAAEALKLQVDDAHLDALSPVSGAVPRSRAVCSSALSSNTELSGLRRDDGLYDDYAGQFGCEGEQGYRYFGFDEMLVL